jgi:DNA-binding transcriptional ArsR family regulator
MTEQVVNAEMAERLAQLVGSARTRILLVLGEPRTTTQVAGQLGIAASTASEHLTVLANADLLARRRRGREVLYQLSDRGQQLLLLLSADSA